MKRSKRNCHGRINLNIIHTLHNIHLDLHMELHVKAKCVLNVGKSAMPGCSLVLPASWDLVRGPRPKWLGESCLPSCAASATTEFQLPHNKTSPLPHKLLSFSPHFSPHSSLSKKQKRSSNSYHCNSYSPWQNYDLTDKLSWSLELVVDSERHTVSHLHQEVPALWLTTLEDLLRAKATLQEYVFCSSLCHKSMLTFKGC